MLAAALVLVVLAVVDGRAWIQALADKPEIRAQVFPNGHPGPETPNAACGADARVVASAEPYRSVGKVFARLDLLYSRHCAMAWPRLVRKDVVEGTPGVLHLVTREGEFGYIESSGLETDRSITLDAAQPPEHDIVGNMMGNWGGGGRDCIEVAAFLGGDRPRPPDGRMYVAYACVGDRGAGVRLTS